MGHEGTRSVIGSRAMITPSEDEEPSAAERPPVQAASGKRKRNDNKPKTSTRAKRARRNNTSSSSCAQSREATETAARANDALTKPHKSPKPTPPPPCESRPRRSARVKKTKRSTRPNDDKLGIPHWFDGFEGRRLFTTTWDADGNGRREPLTDRRGVLVRDGLSFFASKDERLR